MHSVKLYALCVLCGENIHYLQGYKLLSSTYKCNFLGADNKQ